MMNESVTNGCYAASRTRWQRMIGRLFPYAPRPEIGGDPRTYLTTECHIHVDWLDRLRLLVTGRALVQVRTYTDVEVQSAQSVSTFCVIVGR